MKLQYVDAPQQHDDFMILSTWKPHQGPVNHTPCLLKVCTSTRALSVFTTNLIKSYGELCGQDLIFLYNNFVVFPSRRFLKVSRSRDKHQHQSSTQGKH